MRDRCVLPTLNIFIKPSSHLSIVLCFFRAVWNVTLRILQKMFPTDMSQFGLSSSNSHWGYGGAGAYPAYLPSCAAPTATQFNPPALGFAGTVPDQAPTQDFTANNTGNSHKHLSHTKIQR